jgi:hypothetical protein
MQEKNNKIHELSTRTKVRLLFNTKYKRHIAIINYPKNTLCSHRMLRNCQTRRRCGNEKSIIGAHYRFSNGTTNHTLSLSSIGIGCL